MRLLKIILVIFAVYFIRRFIQMYRVMKAIQEKQKAEAQKAAENLKTSARNVGVVNADFKVID